MKEKIVGIVVDIRRHNDTYNIVTLYTKSHGRVVTLSGRGASRSMKLRNARLQPLAVIETDMRLRGNADLQRLGDFSPLIVFQDIYLNPLKNSQVIFIAEFLNRLLRESAPDPVLWQFIFTSLSVFDNLKTGIDNFYIGFLASLLPFAGIMPNTDSFSADSFFDLRTGSFMQFPPLHKDFLEPEAALKFYNLMEKDMCDESILKLKESDRNELTAILLTYYGIHFPGTSNLKSRSLL